MTIAFVGVTATLLAVFSAHFLTSWIQRQSHRYGWLDDPSNQRKIHEDATPTAGGLGIAGGLALGMMVLVVGLYVSDTPLGVPPLAFWGGAAIMLLIGFRDDVLGASFKKKFFVQSAVAYGLLHAGMGIDVNAISPVPLDPYYAALWSVPLTMVWVVGVMNAVNFVDGLDGLAGGIALFALTAFGVLFALQGQWGFVATAAVAGGAVVGFLRHNMHPASIFMGDSGSLLLGYLAAVFPLIGPFDSDPFVNLLIPAVVVGLPILDTANTIVRRMLGSGSIFKPDKDHIHHRLLKQLNEKRAVGVMYGAACWFGLSAILMAMVPPVWAYGVFAVTLVASIGWVVRLGYFTPLASSSRRVRVVMSAWTPDDANGSVSPKQVREQGASERSEPTPPARPAREELEPEDIVEPADVPENGQEIDAQPAQQPSTPAQ
jgi:UDP-GlcNAc:undecaprenyl-phosphate GlcNAc-1-phosphate transferase